MFFICFAPGIVEPQQKFFLVVKKPISTPEAPTAIGAYSQAVEASGFVFVSGQLPIEAGSGLVCGGGGAAQARQSLVNVRAVLKAAGLGMDDVVKVTVYLVDMADFAEVNEVYGEFFETPYPARAVVGVKALPKEARVEIECIAKTK